MNKINLISQNYQKEYGNVENWNEETKNRYILEMINETLKIAQSNEFFKNKMRKIENGNIESLKEFEDIDFTYKDELRGHPYKTVCVGKDKLSQINISTGTTGGECIYVFYSLEDLYGSEIRIHYPTLIPVSKTDMIVNALPYELSSSGLSFQRVFQIGEEAMVLPAGKGGTYSSPEKTVKLMHVLESEILLTTPSHAALLYEIAVNLGLNPIKDFNLKRIWLTGEGCSNNFRKRIEKIWGCEAFYYYGSLECGTLGIECSEKDGYHIPEAHIYIEIVNPRTGEKCKDGEIGEVVTTTLLREGNPFIRYKTGDLGYVVNKKCKCGVNHKKLYLCGREGDQLLINGKSFSPYFIENAIMEVDEIGLWYKLSVENNQLNIIVEPNLKCNSSEAEIMDKVKDAVEKMCNITPKVYVVEKVPRVLTKAIRVIKE